MTKYGTNGFDKTHQQIFTKSYNTWRKDDVQSQRDDVMVEHYRKLNDYYTKKLKDDYAKIDAKYSKRIIKFSDIMK